MEMIWKYGRLSSIPFLKSSIPFHSGIFHISYRNYRSIPFHFPFHSIPYHALLNMSEQWINVEQSSKHKAKRSNHILTRLESCSRGNAFVFRAGGLRFKSRAGQIWHRVANDSPSQRHFFERSCVTRDQWRGCEPGKLVTWFGVVLRVKWNIRLAFQRVKLDFHRFKQIISFWISTRWLRQSVTRNTD